MVERSDLKVEVEARYIVVTLPGTSFRTTFFKRPNAPVLMQSDYMRIDRDAPISPQEFEQWAWEAAIFDQGLTS